jgi:putative endonuclease
MPEFVVYILYSKKYNKFYKGYTTSLIERFKSHNKLARKGYTATYRPWEVVHVEFYETKFEAMKREKFLKHPHKNRTENSKKDIYKRLSTLDMWHRNLISKPRLLMLFKKNLR